MSNQQQKSNLSAEKKDFIKDDKNSSLKKFFLKWFFVGLIWVFISISAVIAYYVHDMPDISKVGDKKQHRIVTFISEDGEVLVNFGDLYSEYITYDRFPKHLIDAVLATEDRRFFNHFGVDVFGLIRAMYHNYKAGRVVEGGSTITQQLAKILFLSPEKTIKRKIQEVFLALYLEHKFTKEEILTIYLNRVYMGSTLYGVGAAAHYYFGKNIEDISLYESAIIAGLLKAPSRYSPINNAELSGRRAYQILVNMEDARYITEAELTKAKEVPVVLETSALGSSKNLYFASYIMDNLSKFTHDTESDLVITTTLNSSLQEIASFQLEKILNENQKQYNIGQGALVTIDTYGRILALVGGKNYAESPFNRAVNAYRQPGSAFKYFTYLAAFENGGYDPDSLINDEPITIKNWSPRNITRKYYGTVTLREAFAKSLNIPAVKLFEDVGRGRVKHMAEKLGIRSKIVANPSLALGTSEVNLLDLTSTFAVMANRGYSVSPYAVISIATKDGDMLYQNKHELPKRLLSANTISYMQDLLHAVVSQGTGRAANIGGAVYGKSGTSQDYRDAWFVGYTNNITTGVWVGNDNNASMKKVTGGMIPARIWHDYTAQAINTVSIHVVPWSVEDNEDLPWLKNQNTEGDALSEPTEETDVENFKIDENKENFWNNLIDSLGN